VVNKDWLDIDVLEDYLDGKLDAKTMNRVEREALEDPFVAEALAGLSGSPKRALASLSILQKQLNERITEQKHLKKQSVITWQRLSIGSAAAVLFITVGVVYWMNQVNYNKSLHSSKKVDVVIAPSKEQDGTLSTQQIPEAIPVPQEKALAVIKKNKTKAVVPSPTMAEDRIASASSIANLQMSRSSAATAFSAMAAPNSTEVVSGQVVDEATGKPMTGAFVSAKDFNGNLKVVAAVDANGQFSFRKDSSIVDTSISVSYVAYNTKVLPISSNQPLIVKLKESTNSLPNGGVIRGYVKRSKETTLGSSTLVSGKELKEIPVGNVEQLLQGKVAGLNIQNQKGVPMTQSHPVNGWDYYYMYLTNNSKFKAVPRVGKPVELSFTIDTSGQPQNIKVLKGISSEYNKEAIRLIKEGPKWLPSEPANAIVSFKIDF
jgi:hypothetical protein